MKTTLSDPSDSYENGLPVRTQDVIADGVIVATVRIAPMPADATTPPCQLPWYVATTTHPCHEELPTEPTPKAKRKGKNQ
jgi:hypothetical protein